MTSSVIKADLQVCSVRLTRAQLVRDPFQELDPVGFDRQHCPQCVPTNFRRDSMASTSKVRGVGPAMEKALAEHGFNSAEDMAAATPERLNGVPGIGAATAPRLIAAAKAVVPSESPSLEKKPGQSGKSKPATRPAELSTKKAAKTKKADNKSGKKSKEKVKKKSKGNSAEKGAKRNPRRARPARRPDRT